jgi:DNA-binding NtrC family response regulator
MIGAECTVLVVDDNAGLRAGLVSLLQGEGIEAHQAERGEEAIRLVRALPFRLLVLDLNLPDMTGVGLYRQAELALPKVPCIFMTAEATEALIEEALRMNPLMLLRKPFETAMFRALVRHALQG